jgi:hypothetical protein
MDGFSGTNFKARIRRNPRLDEVEIIVMNDKDFSSDYLIF